MNDELPVTCNFCSRQNTATMSRLVFVVCALSPCLNCSCFSRGMAQDLAKTPREHDARCRLPTDFMEFALKGGNIIVNRRVASFLVRAQLFCMVTTAKFNWAATPQNMKHFWQKFRQKKNIFLLKNFVKQCAENQKECIALGRRKSQRSYCLNNPAIKY